MRADDTADRVLDAAEARLSRHGFHGTSFRDLAKDVGIKSASVHYHFPTKTELGRAVAERYTQRFIEALGDPADPRRGAEAKLGSLVAAFRTSAIDDRRMCLCGLLATERDGLPEPVQHAVAGFFRSVIDWLTTAFASDDAARARSLRTIAALEGALLVGHVLQDRSIFDKATAIL